MHCLPRIAQEYHNLGYIKTQVRCLQIAQSVVYLRPIPSFHIAYVVNIQSPKRNIVPPQSKSVGNPDCPDLSINTPHFPSNNVGRRAHYSWSCDQPTIEKKKSRAYRQRGLVVAAKKSHGVGLPHVGPKSSRSVQGKKSRVKGAYSVCPPGICTARECGASSSQLRGACRRAGFV
jgi:hypothetical protein